MANPPAGSKASRSREEGATTRGRGGRSGASSKKPAGAGLLDRQLVVVSGKGGVGKTTISAALALTAAERGLHTIVVELGDQRRLPGLFSDDRAPGPGEELELAENVWSVTIDQDRAMLEWLQALGGRVPGRVLAGSGTFQYFAAASPGARELVAMVKIWELTRSERWRRRARRYDLVILDAPATGHALGLLHAPDMFGAIARVGPIFGHAEQVSEMLRDPRQSAYLAVAQPTEMAVGETLDLRAALRSQIGRDLDAAIVNAVLPRRFDGQELARLTNAQDTYARRPGTDDSTTRAVVRSAGRAAVAVHERARIQHNHIARLRRAGLPVHTVPFAFTPELDRETIVSIARRLDSWV
jgi:anion-transporting  ArsA/GET3 family ATPase